MTEPNLGNKGSSMGPRNNETKERNRRMAAFHTIGPREMTTIRIKGPVNRWLWYGRDNKFRLKIVQNALESFSWYRDASHSALQCRFVRWITRLERPAYIPKKLIFVYIKKLKDKQQEIKRNCH